MNWKMNKLSMRVGKFPHLALKVRNLSVEICLKIFKTSTKPQNIFKPLKIFSTWQKLCETQKKIFLGLKIFSMKLWIAKKKSSYQRKIFKGDRSRRCMEISEISSNFRGIEWSIIKHLKAYKASASRPNFPWKSSIARNFRQHKISAIKAAIKSSKSIWPINNHCGELPVTDYLSFFVCLSHSICNKLQFLQNVMKILMCTTSWYRIVIIYCSWSSESGERREIFMEVCRRRRRAETDGEEYLSKRSEMSYKVGNIKGVMLGDNLRCWPYLCGWTRHTTHMTKVVVNI